MAFQPLLYLDFGIVPRTLDEARCHICPQYRFKGRLQNGQFRVEIIQLPITFVKVDKAIVLVVERKCHGHLLHCGDKALLEIRCPLLRHHLCR